MNDIIFEDGLSREKIEKDIDEQGQYKWILDVECENLKVGLKDDAIHVKSGLWISGVWKNGIWG